MIRVRADMCLLHMASNDLLGCSNESRQVVRPPDRQPAIVSTATAGPAWREDVIRCHPMLLINPRFDRCVSEWSTNPHRIPPSGWTSHGGWKTAASTCFSCEITLWRDPSDR